VDHKIGSDGVLASVQIVEPLRRCWERLPSSWDG
jgi:hypothetical protein